VDKPCLAVSIFEPNRRYSDKCDTPIAALIDKNRDYIASELRAVADQENGKAT
jgi:hypothetical protein